jgi:hypothetical protein
MEIRIKGKKLNPLILVLSVFFGFLIATTIISVVRYQKLQDLTNEYCSPNAFCKLQCDLREECRILYYGDPIICQEGKYVGFESKMKWQHVNYTGINGTLPKN